MRTNYLWSLTVLGLGAASMAALSTPAPAAGTISGKVTYTGTPPKMKPIDMAKEPSCASQHETPSMTESVVTGPGNTLQYVVVYISSGDQPVPPPAQVIRYDQKGCTYLPHVATMQTGQALEIYNDDQTSHNIHPLAKANPEWNKSQPPGTPPIRATYDKPEFIAVKCNVHPWMHGYFAVMGTEHFAVTANDGAFSLKGLAPGKYTVTAWHERFGTLSQEVTITGGESAPISFVFKAVPY